MQVSVRARTTQTRPDQTNLFYLHVYSYLTNKYK